MVSSVSTRAFLLACLAFAAAFVPNVSQAAGRYCANRYMPVSQESACFKTKVEAEHYFKDPIDLCQFAGICGVPQNVGGTPFWFGLECAGMFSVYECRK